jgi:hypothetical protein
MSEKTLADFKDEELIEEIETRDLDDHWCEHCVDEVDLDEDEDDDELRVIYEEFRTRGDAPRSLALYIERKIGRILP